jgi:hypothetical protein
MMKVQSDSSSPALKSAASDRKRSQPLDPPRRNSVETDNDEENDGVFRLVGPSGLGPSSESDQDRFSSLSPATAAPTKTTAILGHVRQVLDELIVSSEIVLLRPRLNLLMIGGIVAMAGDTTGALGEPVCFCLSGLALIPCAERYVVAVTIALEEHVSYILVSPVSQPKVCLS